MTDTVSGTDMVQMCAALSAQQMGPFNLALYLRHVPKNLRMSVESIHQNYLLSGSIYDGTWDAGVGSHTNTSQRTFDVDRMFIYWFVMRHRKANIFIQDIEDAPGFASVYSKATGGDIGDMARFIKEKDGKLYLSGSALKAELKDNYGPQNILARTNPVDKYSASVNYLDSGPIREMLIENGYQPTSHDIVPSLACAGWPDIASGWVHRSRHWPPPETVLRCISCGYHLVPKASLVNDPDIQWRYSFSLAESILMDSLSDVQWNCYYICKTWLHLYVPVPGVLSTYHLKTVFFWTCEQTPTHIWAPENLGFIVLGIIDKLIHAFIEKYMQQYFIDSYNMLADISECLIKDVLRQLALLRSKITLQNFAKEFINPYFWKHQHIRVNSFLLQRQINIRKRKHPTERCYLKQIQSILLHLTKEIINVGEIALDETLPGSVYDVLLTQASMLYAIGVFLIQKTAMKVESLGEESLFYDEMKTLPASDDSIEEFIQDLRGDVERLIDVSNIECKKALGEKEQYNTLAMWKRLVQGQSHEKFYLTQNVGLKGCFKNLFLELPNLMSVAQLLTNKNKAVRLCYLKNVAQCIELPDSSHLLNVFLLDVSEEVKDYVKNGRLSTVTLLTLYKNINIIMASCIPYKAPLFDVSTVVYECIGPCRRDKKETPSLQTASLQYFLIDLLRLVLLHVEFNNMHELQLDEVPAFEIVHPCVSQASIYGLEEAGGTWIKIISY